MRGFPLINAAIILVALGLILVPLIKLTSTPSVGPAFANAPADLANDSESVTVSISFRSAHAPESIKVSHLGKTLVDTDTVQATFEVGMAIPEEGVDLLVEVVWPNGTPDTALEVTLEPTAQESLAQVLWAEGSAEEILTFVWQ